jgi:hypothetical protein
MGGPHRDTRVDGEDPSRDVGVRPATSNPEAGVCEAEMLLIWCADRWPQRPSPWTGVGRVVA